MACNVPGTHDMNVVKTAYNTAKNKNVSSKVMLALFEAGLVESNFNNLPCGDSTSLGFLQQKPEYWGGRSSVMNVKTATTSFLNKAIPIENSYSSAGQLAQAVQRSAFPGRYDSVKSKAQELINKVSNGSYDVGVSELIENPSQGINTIISGYLNNLLPFITKLGVYLILVIIIFITLGYIYDQKPLKLISKGVL
jgi:hypothetical protein